MGGEPLQGLPQTVLDVHPGLPVEPLPRPPGVEAAAPHLAGDGLDVLLDLDYWALMPR